MAKNYVDNLSEEARKGMQEKAEQGIWPSLAPHGYRNVRPADGRSIIEVDPVIGPIVSNLFGWYASGDYSLRELAVKAHEGGLINRRSGAPMAVSAIHSVLRNRFYTGNFLYKNQVYRGTHQPLVSHELWSRVQALLDGRSESKLRGATKHDFAFSGLIKCGHCGCAVVGELKKGRYVYYHCTGFKQKCPERYVREEVLEAKLSSLIGQLTFSDDVLEWVTTALRDSHQDEQREHDAAVTRLQAEYERLQARLHAAYIDKLDGKIDAALFESLSAKWREEQDTYSREIAFHQVADRSYVDHGIQLLDVAHQAQALFKTRPPEEKRRLLNFLLSNCSWRDEELTTSFRQPFDLIARTDLLPDPNGGDGDGKSTIRPAWWWTQSRSNWSQATMFPANREKNREFH